MDVCDVHQVKYVVELARALGGTKGVYRVDLLTRQLSGPDVHWSYGEPVEMLTYGDRNSHIDSCGAYIIRLPFGPGQRYMFDFFKLIFIFLFYFKIGLHILHEQNY